MSDFDQVVIRFIAILALIFGATYYAALKGFELGALSVANGEYQCNLIEQEDKTTEWKCYEVKK